MDVLVLGGSVFVGPAVVAAALATGARVTVFNRGKSGPTPEGAEQLVGDRGLLADLEQLAGRRFDLVIDTAGYVPAEVTLAAQLLAPSCGHYVFVSTINVFPGWPSLPDFHAGGVYAGDPDATRADAPDPEAAYGWLKAGCELAVVRSFGAARSTVLRAGCVVGPDDSQVGRLPWWIARVGRGGRVLSPGDPSDPVSVIDARDLARFALLQAPGTFEVGGPPVARAELLSICRDVTGSDARFAWVDASWLAEQDVEEWTEIPLWSTAPSVFLHDPSTAVAAGLRCRPLRDTVADTSAWQQRVPGGWRPAQRTPGLTPDKEAALLAAWDAR